MSDPQNRSSNRSARTSGSGIVSSQPPRIESSIIDTKDAFLLSDPIPSSKLDFPSDFTTGSSSDFYSNHVLPLATSGGGGSGANGYDRNTFANSNIYSSTSPSTRSRFDVSSTDNFAISPDQQHNTGAGQTRLSISSAPIFPKEAVAGSMPSETYVNEGYGEPKGTVLPDLNGSETQATSSSKDFAIPTTSTTTTTTAPLEGTETANGTANGIANGTANGKANGTVSGSDTLIGDTSVASEVGGSATVAAVPGVSHQQQSSASGHDTDTGTRGTSSEAVNANAGAHPVSATGALAPTTGDVGDGSPTTKEDGGDNVVIAKEPRGQPKMVAAAEKVNKPTNGTNTAGTTSAQNDDDDDKKKTCFCF